MKILNKNFALKVFAACLVLFLMTSNIAFSQCPMCRMGLESNLKNGGSAGLGMNLGIMYLLLTPYLLVGGIAYVWWRNKKKAEHDLLNTFTEN